MKNHIRNNFQTFADFCLSESYSTKIFHLESKFFDEYYYA